MWQGWVSKFLNKYNVYENLTLNFILEDGQEPFEAASKTMDKSAMDITLEDDTIESDVQKFSSARRTIVFGSNDVQNVMESTDMSNLQALPNISALTLKSLVEWESMNEIDNIISDTHTSISGSLKEIDKMPEDETINQNNNMEESSTAMIISNYDRSSSMAMAFGRESFFNNLSVDVCRAAPFIANIHSPAKTAGKKKVCLNIFGKCLSFVFGYKRKFSLLSSSKARKYGKKVSNSFCQ
jgi:hypothetical protein